MITLDKAGRINELNFPRSGQMAPVAMRSDEHGGPAWVIHGTDVPLTADQGSAMRFTGQAGNCICTLEYSTGSGTVSILATITNKSTEPLRDLRAGLRLGVDTYMDAYPAWNLKFFPTLLRCEKTHFWGYAMTPKGRILGIASPDPIAAWHHIFVKPLADGHCGHRIDTIGLDLLHPGPLPARHPANLDHLQPGESRTWTIVLADIPELPQVKPHLAKLTLAPMIEIDRYTRSATEPATITIYSTTIPDATLRHPDGAVEHISLMRTPESSMVYTCNLPSDSRTGIHTLTVTNGGGKIAEASLAVRHSWSWYAKRARAKTVAKPQKASSHVESWYGLFPALLARRLFPDPLLDAAVEDKFQEIWPLMYDPHNMQPTAAHDRIQNHACAAGLMAERYLATGNVHDLECAALLADFVMSKQTPDGAYRNQRIHYTCVIYIAKSLMEVMAAERPLAEREPRWRERYERQWHSVRLAMDELARNLDNIETEGEMTYEDGMISCSYSQLALFALLQDDATNRAHYCAAARILAAGHQCLSQILIPDCRMNGGSMRFWEAQYDVLMNPNMLNSPHGWSAWRIYGLWYLYMLTGVEDYLRQTMNALGSCAQLIDFTTGELRWTFIPNPHITAQTFTEYPDNPGRGRCVPHTIGEEYRPMISGWYRAPADTWVSGYWGGDPLGLKKASNETWPNTWLGACHGSAGTWGGDGGCCDNDVHEIFKCLGEVALTAAYVIEREDGTLAAWNCTLCKESDRLAITPAEQCVTRIHLNLRKPATACLCFDFGKTTTFQVGTGMQWIGPGGVPDLLRALQAGIS